MTYFKFINIYSVIGLSGLNTAGTGGLLHEDMKMEIPNSQSYSANLASFMQNPLLHQPHHMHILNIHSHRSLTNSPISNPGSPGLDMIQEEIQINSCSKNETNLIGGHPQICVTDVLGN